jgi:hypothetical protein
MAFKFNPLTGQLDYFEKPKASSIGAVIRSILVERNEELSSDFPTMSVLLDENSVLYNDDEAI